MPKSQLVREAVSRYLNPDADRPAAGLTARALAVQWSGIPRLTPDEASDLDSDIQNARAALPASRSPWE